MPKLGSLIDEAFPLLMITSAMVLELKLLEALLLSNLMVLKYIIKKFPIYFALRLLCILSMSSLDQFPSS